jgi:hypothetical protein
MGRTAMEGGGGGAASVRSTDESEVVVIAADVTSANSPRPTVPRGWACHSLAARVRISRKSGCGRGRVKAFAIVSDIAS